MTPTAVGESIEQFRERFVRITQEVGRRIVGHEEVVEPDGDEPARRRPRPARGHPGRRARRASCTRWPTCCTSAFSRIQFTPDLMPADIVGTNIVQERPARRHLLRVPARPDLRQRGARRRDQPRDAEDAVGAARGDAGHQRLGRQDHLPARRAVPRARDAESARDGRHLSAAGSAARSVLLQAEGPVSVRSGDARHPGAHDARRATPVARVVDGPAILEMRHVARSVADRAPGAGLRDPAHARIASRLALRDARSSSDTCATARARARRRRSCSRPRFRRSIAARRSCRSTTSARSRCRRCATGILLNFEGEADEVSTDTHRQRAAGRASPRRDGLIGHAPPFPGRFPQEARVPARRLEARVRRAEPRGPAHAASAAAALEFADHRPYTPGDDFRHIDWKAYKRLNRLLLRLFDEEQDLPIYLFLDVSRSMAEPAKFDQARRIAAALCYVGLAHLDRVTILTFARRARRRSSRRDAARAHLPRVRTARAARSRRPHGFARLVQGVRLAAAAGRARP